jgi:hypothetical protein
VTSSDDPNRNLTKKIAHRFVEDETVVDLSEFATIDDNAAEVLSTFQGNLVLDGLQSLSAHAAILLGAHTPRATESVVIRPQWRKI